MRILVLFATRQGHAHRVADHVATTLRERNAEVDVLDVKTLHAPIDWHAYSAACVAASVHGGHHEPEMIAFAKENRAALERLPAAFLSITLSEAGAEDHTRPFDQRQQAANDARRMVEVFVAETGWRPAHTLCVAGALTYSRYNFFIKWIMKRIARKAGAPTDTSRDYEFTDWPAVDECVGDVLKETAARH